MRPAQYSYLRSQIETNVVKVGQYIQKNDNEGAALALSYLTGYVVSILDMIQSDVETLEEIYEGRKTK